MLEIKRHPHQLKTTSITWNASGKVEQVTLTNGDKVQYLYDAAGNRVAKLHTQSTTTSTTRYVRDASGNTMAVYKNDALAEVPIYGSSRLGMYTGANTSNSRTLGNKSYELTNHLGNVMAVVTDDFTITTDGVTNTKEAEVIRSTDYYPFGLEQPGTRATSHTAGSSAYRYGFNGKERDQSFGNVHYDYGFRIYNPEIGKFLSVDPLTKSYPSWSPYPFAMNRPIDGIDLDGLEFISYLDVNALMTWGEIAKQATESTIDGMVYTTTSLISGLVEGTTFGFSQFVNGNGYVSNVNVPVYGFSFDDGIQETRRLEEGRPDFGDGQRLMMGTVDLIGLGITGGGLINDIAGLGTKWKGKLYRYEIPDRVSTTWDTHKYNVAAEHRYTGSGNGGVYGGTSPETAYMEISHYGAQDGRVLVSKEFSLNNVLDLTNVDIRKRLGVSLDEITSDSYDVTQQLGNYARENGFDGILAPSARNANGSNMVILNSND
ncbi:RES domain-containing protein [Marinoscillum furvescens]|uniref:RHS repeat-associated protein n=1 Tax=Marinoscillum furvescens DSM 4134 TaxID=1122208 RepID=A0A3D9LK62_MARFU|nr:RES domain-containing protein [Marinoscillum furvescens]REE05632.1 RHS repeat-associated protein [Marinoscillum furvescens DSM 4134]